MSEPDTSRQHQPTAQEIKSWYNRRYANRGFNAMRTPDAYPVFLDDLDVQPGRSLLDIACGTGYLLRAAADRGLITTGVDISEEAVKLARQVSPESDIRVASAEALPFADNSFDYICCLGSLEHFLDMEKGLAEMKRVARADARFCIMVPNSRFLGWKVAGKPGTEQQDINEHLQTLEEWQALFLRHGFSLLRVRQDRWPMKKIRPFASANPLKIVRALLFKLVWALLPLRYGYQFVFILKRL